MRALHILDTLGRGGAEMLMLDVCNNASSNELDIVLLATGGGILEEQFKNSPIEYFRFDRNRALDFNVVQYIQRILVEKRIDVIHSHQPVTTLHALIAAKPYAIPVVHTIHGFTADIKNKLVFRYILGKTSANILVSNTMDAMCKEREWVREIPRSHVVYNGIDSKRLTQSPCTLRNELGLPKDSFLLGMVGNFYSVKDQLTICKAMKTVVKKLPHTHCVFAGRADDMRLFRQCRDVVTQNNLGDNVHFLGGRNDIPNILGSLDVFIFSTLADTFGLALVEAMMAGKACIVSDISVMKEMSSQGKYARTFMTGNEDELAQRILELENSSARENLADSARQYALHNFSISSHIENLVCLYSSLSKSNISSNHSSAPIHSNDKVFSS